MSNIVAGGTRAQTSDGLAADMQKPPAVVFKDSAASRGTAKSDLLSRPAPGASARAVARTGGLPEADDLQPTARRLALEEMPPQRACFKLNRYRPQPLQGAAAPRQVASRQKMCLRRRPRASSKRLQLFHPALRQRHRRPVELALKLQRQREASRQRNCFRRRPAAHTLKHQPTAALVQRKNLAKGTWRRRVLNRHPQRQQIRYRR